VRYDAHLVRRDQAFAAYDAALAVCAEAARHIRRSTAQESIGRVHIRIGAGAPIEALMLGYLSGCTAVLHQAAGRATRLPHRQARGEGLGAKVYRFNRSGDSRGHRSG
jgi:hypothetical protein